MKTLSHKITAQKIGRGKCKAGNESESGQVMVESLLMLIIFLAIATYTMKSAKSNQWFASLLSAPWGAVSNMIENGVWETNVQTARAENPLQFARVVSFKGAPDAAP